MDYNPQDPRVEPLDEIVQAEKDAALKADYEAQKRAAFGWSDVDRKTDNKNKSNNRKKKKATNRKRRKIGKKTRQKKRKK